MRSSVICFLGLISWQTAAPAQTINEGTPAAFPTRNDASYRPLTATERWRSYLIEAYGPGAILRATAAAGISQWDNQPKEWKQGSEAFAKRLGNSFAEDVIRNTLEAAVTAGLKEDNRYFRSIDAGVWRRTKHAIGATFMARNEAGRAHIAYSRIGAAAGASFISRAWQPPGTTSSGDAAVNFGITMATVAGWNLFKQFSPTWLRKRL